MDGDLHTYVHITSSFPVELHYIKALYLNHQYKECARRCEDLLGHSQDEPAHVVFLNFYAALSHEGLAKIMHNYSVWRLPKISAAESAYNKALDACSEAEHRLEECSTLSLPGLALDHLESHLAASSSIHVRKRNSKPSLAHLGPGLDTSHTKSSKHAERVNFSWLRSFTPLSCATVKAIQYSVCQDMMSPLEDPFTVSSSESSSGGTSAQDTPIKTDHLSANNIKDAFDSSHPPSPTPSYRSVQPSESRAHAAYLAHLTALHDRITTHLHQLLELKQSTITEQEERVRRQSGSISSTSTTNTDTKLPKSRSFWSFKDAKVEKKEKLVRIDKGRARNWKTKRFEPKRYTELARNALAELE
ncbi:unnamed protein product [Aureobasidium uvarum]|uniref:Uncharacterized protein n=1 Tax=Aureobasidium uvarum TaxID=2773716 RepID=A0A9N8KQQ4_9PEZI|nr:unnamed protein product [Aureobasidium uvarum]